jgi:hypothetical protein
VRPLITVAQLLDNRVIADARRAREDEYTRTAQCPQITDNVVRVFSEMIVGTARRARHRRVRLVRVRRYVVIVASCSHAGACSERFNPASERITSARSL